MKPIVLQRST